MKTVQAVVFAGGRGVRMRELTVNRQKCLLPIDGKPALGFVMEALVEAFDSVHMLLCISFRDNEVRKYVDRNKPNKMTVTYVSDDGTLGSWQIFKGLRVHIQGPFVALAGDVIALPHAYKDVLQLFLEDSPDLVLSLSPKLDEIDTHPVGKMEGNRVVQYDYSPPAFLDSDHLRDTHIWASDERIFEMLDRYTPEQGSIRALFKLAFERNRTILGVRYLDHWIHLGYPSDLEKTMSNNYSRILVKI